MEYARLLVDCDLFSVVLGFSFVFWWFSAGEVEEVEVVAWRSAVLARYDACICAVDSSDELS